MKAADVKAFGNRAAEVGEDLWPGEVEIDGTTYTAEVPAPRSTFDVVEGRELQQGRLVVKIRKALLPERPDENQPLAYGGQVWWIDSVREANLEDRWLLECTPKN